MWFLHLDHVELCHLNKLREKQLVFLLATRSILQGIQGACEEANCTVVFDLSDDAQVVWFQGVYLFSSGARLSWVAPNFCP